MPAFTCSRCQKTAGAMDSLPFPGDLGLEVQQQVCAVCWKEWLGVQVNLINEHRFTMVNPQHREFLTVQMKEFLNLKG
ncbi:MAG: Fe(2+)-trafficking protein [Acidobacteriota bacterium]